MQNLDCVFVVFCLLLAPVLLIANRLFRSARPEQHVLQQTVSICTAFYCTLLLHAPHFDWRPDRHQPGLHPTEVYKQTSE